MAVNNESESLLDFFRRIHSREGGTGIVLNVIRGAKARAAAELSILIDLVSDPTLKLELARHASDEVRHVHLLLRRMGDLGVRAFRLPEALDRLDGLLARSRARDLREVYANRGTVSEAELMELIVAAHVVKCDSVRKLSAHRDVLADAETRALLSDVITDESRHLTYLGRWIGRFEERFSRRAVARARERLEDALTRVDFEYYCALEHYSGRVAA